MAGGRGLQAGDWLDERLESGEINTEEDEDKNWG